MNFKTCLITLSLLVFSLLAHAQGEKRTLSGYVKEKGSGEHLPGVSIYLPGTSTGVTSNSFGFYSLTLPEGSYEVAYSFVGYNLTKAKVNLVKDVELNIDLIPSVTELSEIEVKARESVQVSDEVQMSTVQIPADQIQDIPAFLGEKDVIKVVQLLPGVQSGREGSAGLYVRGGSDDQNLIILDDATVYNAQHLFGFFSVFNGDALKSVELYKGGFPARFGGRLSSVLDMQMKDGHKEEYHGKVGVGLISSNITLEGPIKKGKSSALISARRTYIDALVRPTMPEGIDAGYYFYDINAKLNFDLGTKDRLFISGYFGQDKFFDKFKEDNYNYRAGINWGNSTGTLRWNHQFNNKLFSNTSFIVSRYSFNIETEENINGIGGYELTYASLIDDFTLKLDFDFIPSPKHAVKIGAFSTLHRFAPSALVFQSSYEGDQPVNTTKYTNTLENAIYIEDDFRPNDKWHFNLGLRYSLFHHDGKYYNRLEPRVAAAYKLAEKTAIKASYATMNQYVHKLSNTGVGLPTDLWVTSTKNVAPQNSRQVAFGFAQDLPNNFLITLEGYYKWSNDVVQYKEGASFLLLDFEEGSDVNTVDWQENITRGRGDSYGLELLIQRKFGKITGWIGYTLSWAQLHFDDLNGGNPFWASWDRRNDLSVVGIYKPTPRITLSTVWVYGTGSPFTLPNATYKTRTHELPSPNVPDAVTFNFNDRYLGETAHYDEKNSFRGADFHRLDFSVQFHKQKSKHRIRTWEVSIYNAYGRQNPFYHYIDYNYGNDGTVTRSLVQMNLFRWVPSASYKIEF